MKQILSKNGKIYWCDPDDRYYIERLLEGQYQLTNWKYAKTLITRRRRAIDIGSNNACNAVHYSDYFDHVECFEPFPYNQQLWQKTVNDNMVTNCNLHPVGLGSHSHQAKFLTHPKNHGHNYVYYDKAMSFQQGQWKSVNNRARNARVEILIHTLDQYQFSDVDFIKIDVEGFELSVLLGGEQTIRASLPVLQLEIVPKQCRHFGYHPEDMVKLLQSWGYAMFSKRRGLMDLKFSSDNKYLYYDHKRIVKEMDFFFVHESEYSLWPTFNLVADVISNV